jgi:C-terminal processing protease CtpA/Prc
MQLNKLAEVIGVPTPGQLLWGQSFTLQTDLIAVIPVARIVYPNSSSIEAKGIMPDRIVRLSREDFLNGTASRLEAAIELLQFGGQFTY